MKYSIISLLLFTTAFSQAKSDFVNRVERAHGVDKFKSHDAIQFDIVLIFGGKERLNAKITILTNSSQASIEKKNGDRLIIINNQVYRSSTYTNPKGARFDAYTWTYFFLYPFKLSDPGTIWSPEKRRNLNGNSYNVATLTFESNIGDAPDDRYITFVNPNSNMIEKVGYIVTFGKSKAEAMKNQRAISYDNYVEVDGVYFSDQWSFWSYDENQGLIKKSGEAKIRNIKFLTQDEVLFDISGGMIEVKLD